MTDLGNMVGFVITTDYEKARVFYVDKLGFKFVSQDPYALVVTTGKNMIRISKTNEFTPARHTVLGWGVSDIDAVVASMKKNGIEFEDYPFIDDHNTRIWNAPGGGRVAWFKDSDGNVLSVSQH